jgi:hypothetical protein
VPTNIKRIQYFLIGTGTILFIGSGIRFYRLIRTHTENYFFAPNLLSALLSLWIAWKVLKVGWENNVITRKRAITLIRSGSLLLMIWGYRLFLLLATENHERDFGIAPILAILYVVMGTAVMCLGLKINRSFPMIHNGN